MISYYIALQWAGPDLCLFHRDHYLHTRDCSVYIPNSTCMHRHIVTKPTYLRTRMHTHISPFIGRGGGGMFISIIPPKIESLQAAYR